MDFRQVRYFLAVADHGSFRRAAETIHVAQSALSKHISELEARLALTLFDRLRGGVRLTQAGEAYAREARRALDLMERAEARAGKAARGEIDRLTVAMNDIGARNAAVARALADYAAAYSEVELELPAMTSQHQLAALRYGRIDAGVLIERPDDPAFDHLAIADDPFLLALPGRHRLARRKVIDVAALAQESFVSVAMRAYWSPQTRLMARCRALGLTPRVVIEAGTDHMQICFVAAGMGLGFVNASIAAVAPRDVALRPVAGLDVSLQVDLVWLRASLRPSLANFITALRRALRRSRTSGK